VYFPDNHKNPILLSHKIPVLAGILGGSFAFEFLASIFATRKPARPAPAELPQDRKVARVGGCSGAMSVCFFYFLPCEKSPAKICL
jgi:hypothetical protein